MFIRQELQELFIPRSSNYTMNLNNIFLFILRVAKGGALSSIRLPTERVPP